MARSGIVSKQFYMDQEQGLRLRRLAAAKGLRQADLLRQLVEQALTAEEAKA